MKNGFSPAACGRRTPGTSAGAKRRFIRVLALWLAMSAVPWSAAARAFDVVKTTVGPSITGRVTKMSALEVTAEQGQMPKNVPINQIEVIYYDNEPTLLKTARTAVAAGRYEDALAAMEKIDPATVQRAEIMQDIEFYKALSAARMALAGRADVKQAGSQMAAFVNKNSGNYHYLEACEVVGDLLVADRQYTTAETFYGYLAKAPWPDYKMRAGLAVGRAQLAGGKPAEALKSFETVLAIEDPSATAGRYRVAATLGKARCLADAGQTDEAIKLVQEVIDRTDPEESKLLADAYNTLGVAYRKAGRPKDALLAFLHVDVLYFSSPAEHIEALQNLNELWMEVQKPARAADAARMLRDRYHVSPRNE